MNNTIYYIIAAVVVIFLFLAIFYLLKKKKKRTEISGFPPKKADTLQHKLAKTKHSFLGKIAEVLTIQGKVDEEMLEKLEETLIQADVGVQTSMDIIEKVREAIRSEKISEPSKVQEILQKTIRNLLLQDYSHQSDHLQISRQKPFVILFTGVNGVGKTTTIGKLAKRYKDKGNKVMLIAADTFRAAASEQLTIWAERSGSAISKQQPGADPSSVVYDGLMAAKTRNYDLVLIDTAGRQHTKVNLMNELSKLERTIKKIVPDAPHETLLVVDSTTGQNALTQAEMFNKATRLSGLVLTKLDGTAKGGIVIGIKHQLQIPVKLIGVGEQQEDLRDFDAKEFVEAIFH